MRKELEDFINEAIIIKYNMPFSFRDGAGQQMVVEKSNLTATNKDEYCFQGNDKDISKIIYNGIVEFAENEFKIDYEQLNIEQIKAIKIKLRYNQNDKSEIKLQYGFYGEVLLDVILRSYFQTNVLIARGYFYSPLEKAEAKGFDAFHLMDNNGKIELWFGEAKFHKSFSSAIKSVLSKMNSSLSDDYLNDHILAIIKEKNNISNSTPELDSIIEKWEQNPDIILVEELRNNDIELIYPIFIAYQKQITYTYEESIKSCVEKINSELSKIPFIQNISVKVAVFVMLLPVDDSNELKKEVIEWIEKREPLI